MSMWVVVLAVVVAIILAFPAAILICVFAGWSMEHLEKARLHLWLKKRSLYKGKVNVRWPANDVREEIRIVDLTRIDRDEIGFVRRQYGMLHRKTPPPSFGGQEYVSLKDL